MFRRCPRLRFMALCLHRAGLRCQARRCAGSAGDANRDRLRVLDAILAIKTRRRKPQSRMLARPRLGGHAEHQPANSSRAIDTPFRAACASSIATASTVTSVNAGAWLLWNFARIGGGGIHPADLTASRTCLATRQVWIWRSGDLRALPADGQENRHANDAPSPATRGDRGYWPGTFAFPRSPTLARHRCGGFPRRINALQYQSAELLKEAKRTNLS
jgi:hypothetical protein